MRLGKTFLLGVLGLSLVIGSVSAQATSKVVVEYFRFDLSDIQCDDCPIEEYYRVDSLVRHIETEYDDQISIERLDTRYSAEAKERFQRYNLTRIPAIVIAGGEHVLEGVSAITGENLRAAIDESLGRGPGFLGLTYMFFSEAATAFSMGIVSGFSPCLLGMLAFILTYTAGTSDNLKRGTVRALIFGVGLVVAIVLLGSLILSLGPTTFTPAMAILKIAGWIAAGIIILSGLNLVGILKLPFSTKPFIQRLLAHKSAFNVGGLFLLGFVFFFVKLPCAFPLFFVLLFEVSVATTLENALLLLIFSLGVLLPFLGLGLIGGGTPRLAKIIKGRYRWAIRTLSGVILIVYGIWVMYQLIASPVYRIFP